MDDHGSTEVSPERRLIERRRLVLAVDADGSKHAVQGSLPVAPRRSGSDRRKGERRVVSIPVDRDRRTPSSRRAGADRRSGASRRGSGDRRAQGPMAFTREEAGLIVARAAQPGAPVACPRCDSTLTLRPPVASEGGSIWNVHCSTCKCRLRIKNL